ncbi:MAG TPA: insulinase family protein [Bacteroidota bacterium]|nr:insulinase family protein [Bacteroidota bacterium]
MNLYRIIHRAVVLLCLLSMAAFLLQASDTGGTFDVHALPKGVSIYQLDNGMRVLFIENPALPMIGVNVIVKSGSANESFSTSGMSHMLEHLLFNGTTTRTQKQLYDDVDRIGGYNNASTREFFTNYMMVTPTENIRRGMEIQADMLFNSTLPAAQFEKEKGIVLEEIGKSLANAQEQYERNTLSVLYDGHALSLPTLGTSSTIQSMSRADVNAFYKNTYVPNNMILSVIGSFKTSAMLPLISEIYGKAASGQVIRPAHEGWGTGLELPMVPQPHGIYHRFYDGESRSLQIFIPVPTSSLPEYFELMDLVLEKSADGIQSSMKKEFPAIVTSVKLSTRQSHIQNYIEAIVLLARTGEETSIIRSLSSKLGAMNFTLPPETIASEATKARTEFGRNIEKPHMFGIYNSEEIVKHGIEALIASSSGENYQKAANELETLTLGTPSLILVQTPSAKKDVEKASSGVITKGFIDPARGKNLIVSQNEASTLLAIHYLVKHKAPLEAKYGKDASKILHDCFGQRLKSDANMKTGSRFGFTYTVNDNPAISMDDIYLHPDFGYIRVEGISDDIAGGVEFINSQIRGFVPTEAEFDKAVGKYRDLAMMSMGGDKTAKLFEREYKGVVYEPNPYAKSNTQLTYQSLVAFAKEYFQPGNMIVSVVSPASPDSVDALFNSFFTSAMPDEPKVYTPVLTSASAPVAVEKPGGGERSYLFYGFISQIDPADAPAIQALSLVLSNQIVFTIREKQGMAYQMSAGIEVIGDKALFFINQGTRPQNVEKLVPQYPRFFNSAVLDSVTQQEIEKSVNMYLGKMMFRRLSSINQAFYLGSSMYFTGDYNSDTRFLEALRSVKLEDVRRVAKKYMVMKNPILVAVK